MLTLKQHLPASQDVLLPEKPPCNCGVIAYLNPNFNSTSTYTALEAQNALKHRGNDGAGALIISPTQGVFHSKLGGDVTDVTTAIRDNIPRFLLDEPHLYLGHNRYGTTGEVSIHNLQPYVTANRNKLISVAHNGNLINHDELKFALVQLGYNFQSTSDTEVILHLLALVDTLAPNIPPQDKLRIALNQVQGAYSLVVTIDGELFAVKDRGGVLPLCYGKGPNGELIASSESWYLESQGIRTTELERGAILHLSKSGEFKTYRGPQTEEEQFCMLGNTYVLHFKSKQDGVEQVLFRASVGEQLAKQYGRELDQKLNLKECVIGGIPNTAIPYVQGFARELGLTVTDPPPVYISPDWNGGRTYIASGGPRERIERARAKYRANKDVVRGRKVVEFDDSIVRGHTAVAITEMLLEAGAAEVHLLSGTPKVIYPCQYGIQMFAEELIARREFGDKVYARSDKAIARLIGANSVRYLSPEMFREIKKGCMACVTGEYPLGKMMPFEKLPDAGLALSRHIQRQIGESYGLRVLTQPAV